MHSQKSMVPSSGGRKQSQSTAQTIANAGTKSQATTSKDSFQIKPKIFGQKPELPPEQKVELCKAFGLFDPRGAGLVDSRALFVALRAMTYEPTNKQIEALFLSVFGTDSNTKIDFKMFTQLMEAKMLEDMQKEDVEMCYKLFCDPKIGGITFSVLKDIAEELGENMPEEEIQEMIRFADWKDGDGLVAMEEFSRILKRPELELE